MSRYIDKKTSKIWLTVLDVPKRKTLYIALEFIGHKRKNKMKVIIIILEFVVIVVAIFAIVLRQHNSKLYSERFKRIATLHEKLKNGQNLTGKDVYPFAQNILTREITFLLLNDHDKTDLFPQEYYSIVKGAESNLANWLEFPTKLGVCPEEIEYIKRVTIDFDKQKNQVHYEVFKFRVNEHHWASKDGWLLGVVGPYYDDSKPYDFPNFTNSRFVGIDHVSPEEEVKWAHENRKG